HIDRIDALNPVMIELSYEPMGEYGISGRRFFRKGGEVNRSHHVHAYESTNPEVKKHLDFRDYLIAHSAEARQYGELKKELALKFPHDIEGYIEGKGAFVKEIIRRAAEWREIQTYKTSDAL
ncbi:MAG TPA: GrpB family protein, partial [Anaerolineae bacterium]|nr:GrpB family protein [Anaerolineae bacterium]